LQFASQCREEGVYLHDAKNDRSPEQSNSNMDDVDAVAEQAHIQVQDASRDFERRLIDPKTIISFLLGIALLIFALTRSDIDPKEAIESIRDTNLWLYALGLATFYLSFLLRAIRWRGMLQRAAGGASEGGDDLSLRSYMHIILVSWFVNCVLPAKLGDAFRGYLLKDRTAASFSRTMGTILAERLADLVVLVSLLLIAGAVVFGAHLPDNENASRTLILGIVVVIIGILGTVILWLAREHLERYLPERFALHFTKLHNGIFGSLRRPIPILMTTVLIWVLDGLRLWTIAKSLGIDLHVAESQAVSLGSALVTIVPFTPGGLGLVEAFMIWSLGQVDVSRSEAIALAFLDRSITYGSLVVLGIPLYLLLVHRRGRRKKLTKAQLLT
jgi:uncharacterized protein (TIRG00374 family)